MTLYERLGGVFAIATVVDDFIDRVMNDPRLNANPKVDEAHHKVAPAGFKYLVTEQVCEATPARAKSGRSPQVPTAKCRCGTTMERWFDSSSTRGRWEAQSSLEPMRKSRSIAIATPPTRLTFLQTIPILRCNRSVKVPAGSRGRTWPIDSIASRPANFLGLTSKSDTARLRCVTSPISPANWAASSSGTPKQSCSKATKKRTGCWIVRVVLATSYRRCRRTVAQAAAMLSAC